MTPEILTKLGLDPIWADPLAETFERFEINTPERQSAFIGQCMHESGNFKTLKENLNYSAKGLHATWPARFPSEEEAAPYNRAPEKIANKVYADRMGNGDEASGDGWKYHGRGLIQLTGKSNYKAAGDALGVDLVATPELVEQPKYAALTAGWFWSAHDLNALADAENNEAITKRINGGTLGLEDRIAKTSQVFEALA